MGKQSNEWATKNRIQNKCFYNIINRYTKTTHMDRRTERLCGNGSLDRKGFMGGNHITLGVLKASTQAWNMGQNKVDEKFDVIVSFVESKKVVTPSNNKTVRTPEIILFFLSGFSFIHTSDTWNAILFVGNGRPGLIPKFSELTCALSNRRAIVRLSIGVCCAFRISISWVSIIWRSKNLISED